MRNAADKEAQERADKLRIEALEAKVRADFDNHVTAV
jgi:hypothetical protein